MWITNGWPPDYQQSRKVTTAYEYSPKWRQWYQHYDEARDGYHAAAAWWGEKIALEKVSEAPSSRWMQKTHATLPEKVSEAAKDLQEGWECYMVKTPPTDAADPAAGDSSNTKDKLNINENCSSLFENSGCEFRKDVNENTSESSFCDTLCSKIPTLAVPHKRCGDRVSCSEEEAKDSHASTLTDGEKVKMHKKDKSKEETGREEVGLGSRCSWFTSLDQDEADPPSSPTVKQGRKGRGQRRRKR